VPGGGEVDLYDVAARKLAGPPIHTSIGTSALTFLGIPNRVTTVAFSPDGTLLAIGSWEQPTLEVWSTVRRTRVALVADNQDASTPPATDGAKWLAFSPDGKLLAIAGLDGDVRIYGVPGFTLLDHIGQKSNPATTLAFSPDGRKLADGTGLGDIYLYSVPTSYQDLPKQLYRLPTLSSGNKMIASVQFSPDGTLIAGGYDDDVRFWAAPSAGGNGSVTGPSLTLATHGGGQIGQVSYSARLGLLVTADTRVTRVWETDPAKVAAAICQTLKAPVQPALWKQYLPTIAYTPVCP
jgi:WD40 repeat protein